MLCLVCFIFACAHQRNHVEELSNVIFKCENTGSTKRTIKDEVFGKNKFKTALKCLLCAASQSVVILKFFLLQQKTWNRFLACFVCKVMKIHYVSDLLRAYELNYWLKQCYLLWFKKKIQYFVIVLDAEWTVSFTSNRYQATTLSKGASSILVGKKNRNYVSRHKYLL